MLLQFEGTPDGTSCSAALTVVKNGLFNIDILNSVQLLSLMQDVRYCAVQQGTTAPRHAYGEPIAEPG